MQPFNFQNYQGSSSSTFNFSKTISDVFNDTETIECEYCDNPIDKKTSKCSVCNSSIHEMPSRKVFVKKETSKGFKAVQVSSIGKQNPFNKFLTGKKGWECHNCHSTNSVTDLCCQKCSCKKRYTKTESTIPIKKQRLDNEWTCIKCSFVNKNSYYNCEICFQGRSS